MKSTLANHLSESSTIFSHIYRRSNWVIGTEGLGIVSGSLDVGKSHWHGWIGASTHMILTHRRSRMVWTGRTEKSSSF